ncbi:ATP-dependent RecD-like DNA helicase [Virgibacillus phasianinus]|uniref:ATP-dependent RecD2 DNA helicase n=1 Tax=Virgibacillus phasianinus TaxID=2017483 RepID=A0A220U5W0_9BACI|nr:ATP-dependent RecD-like DNA helicase [Virgibacillus phasianinus]ASK63103.1 ATP-dependent RecD-like DNA helicase [Virgibacillus phasianinus]
MANVEQMGEPDIQKYIKGELLYTIFHNDAEHFSIAKIKVLDTNEELHDKEIVVKGYFSNLQETKDYIFYGQMERHNKFGLQYQVTSYESNIPETTDGLIAYLSSDLFYGIGKKTASKIINHLGENAISQILTNPDVLTGVQGLKADNAEHLVKTLQENEGFEHVVVHLGKFGIGLKLAQKIYQVYKDESIDVLNKDPYQYVFDVEGFGFQKADEIANVNGLSLTHPNRIGAGCIFVLQKSVQEGHVYLPAEECIVKVIQLLGRASAELDEDTIKNRLDGLNTEKKIIVQEGKVYLPSLYYAEDGFASQVKRLITKPVEHDTPLAEMMKIIGDIEEAETLSYGKEQFHAINQALHAKLMIVTGGPGTGKTTVIKGIVDAYSAIHRVSIDPKDYEKKSEYPFVFTAPTGRAAKRLTESTGLPAVTIHRLLGWDGNNGFDKDQNEPLSGKFLIVDEFSMVDIWLANSLFKAIPDDMQVLLVGDEDQLPSVGPGQVLTDLLASDSIPFVSLNEVYRQKEGSKIIQLAHTIKNDECTNQTLRNDKDFSFLTCNQFQMVDVITKIFASAEKKGINLKDIQVLAPMYRTEAGITVINKTLQEIVNPKTKRRREVKVYDTVFRVGDKVLQLVNQPEDGVSNGDIGEIVAIFFEDENKENVEQIVVTFEGKEVVYERKDYTNIMHAYCISIHKSQGSEFPIVVMPVVSTYRRMLRKNLLYTAITRSKQSLIICGEKQAFLQGVNTMDTNKRYTDLIKQLRDRLPSDQDNEAAEENMEDEITPYDFM